MTKVSIDDAENGLPRLVDRVVSDEQVALTRDGHGAIKLRPTESILRASSLHYMLLKKERDARKSVDVTSVRLLRSMYGKE